MPILTPDELAAVMDFRPDAAHINALPAPLRKFIHDIETTCDPAGDTASRICALDDRDALFKQVEELKAENAGYIDAAFQLFNVLQDKWNPEPPKEALGLFLIALACGLKQEWLKHAPENGLVTSITLPEVGPVEITIRRVSGKTAPERILEMKEALDGLRTEDGCWCSTGEGNPHTQACLNVSSLFLLGSTDRPWRCFHCGFETSIEEEAAAHFGDRDDAEEFKPLCRWWNRMTPEERGQALQDVIQQLNGERDESRRLAVANEGLAYRVDGFDSEIAVRFKGCRTINEAWHRFESMEGRLLCADERVRLYEGVIESAASSFSLVEASTRTSGSDYGIPKVATFAAGEEKKCRAVLASPITNADRCRLNRLQELLNAGDLQIEKGTDIRKRLDMSGAKVGLDEPHAFVGDPVKPNCCVECTRGEDFHGR